MEEENDNQSNQPKKGWFERNLWWIATFIALFLVRMCSELSKS